MNGFSSKTVKMWVRNKLKNQFRDCLAYSYKAKKKMGWRSDPYFPQNVNDEFLGPIFTRAKDYIWATDQSVMNW